MWLIWTIVAGVAAGLVIWWQFLGARNPPSAPGQSDRSAPVIQTADTAGKAESNFGPGNADAKFSHHADERLDARSATEQPTAVSGSVSASDASEDDLTKIKGIGGVLQGKLNNLGIVSFRQIAEFTQEDINRIDTVLDFPGRIERDRWVDQARTLLARED